MSKRLMMMPLALVAALTLVAGACGSDDDSASTTTEKSTETTEKDATTTTSKGSGGDDVDPGGVPGVSPECAELQEAFTSLDVQSMMSSFTDGSNPAPQFQNFADALKVAEDKAPAAISGDLEALASGYDELAKAADGVDWDAIKSGDPAASAEAGKLMSTFNSDALADAAKNVSDWINENCVP